MSELKNYIIRQYDQLNESAGSNGCDLRKDNIKVDKLQKKDSLTVDEKKFIKDVEKRNNIRIRTSNKDDLEAREANDNYAWLSKSGTRFHNGVHRINNPNNKNFDLHDKINSKVQNESGGKSMKNLSNNQLAELLTEAALLLNEDTSTNSETEVLTEDSGLGALIAFFATYIGAFIVLPLVANSMAKRSAAKNAKAISKEELSDAVKFFNTIGERVRTLFKQSTYKKYVEDGIITIHDKYTDFSDRKEIKHIAFEITYPVVTVNMVKLLKAYGKYDETVATDERLNDFLKKEAEKLAKILDKIREIIHQNKFVKDNFTLMLVPNENKTIYQMLIMAKSPLVFDSSKYVKNKK